MKLEMTQKDKNLLIMLSIFVIVVCIGYWGIYPVVKGIVNTNKEIPEEYLFSFLRHRRKHRKKMS